MYKFSEYDKKLGKKILTNKLWKKIISSTYRKNFKLQTCNGSYAPEDVRKEFKD